MSEQETPPRPILRALRVAAIVALVAALAYQAMGAAIFLPRFGSDDPREVVTAYCTAQRWGYRAIAEQALTPELREGYHAPNAVRGLHDDAFLSSDLVVSEPRPTTWIGVYDEERHGTVEYRSVWESGPLGAPGKRLLFFTVGRNGNDPWRITSIGTGP